MTAPELKPCPFCERAADISHDHTVEENHAYGCRKCDMWFDSFNSENAITAWNARATHDRLIAEAVAAERERCAKVADASAQSDLDYADKYPDEAGRYERTAHRAKTIAAAIRGQS